MDMTDVAPAQAQRTPEARPCDTSDPPVPSPPARNPFPGTPARAALEAAELATREDGVTVIEHETIGGRPAWLRAEPDFDADQADALAAIIAVAMRQPE